MKAEKYSQQNVNRICEVCALSILIHCYQCGLKYITELSYCPLPALCLTITDDHASLQRLISKGLVADAARPLVDIEEAAHTVARTVKVIQPRIPESCTGKRIQQVT